MSDPSVEAAQRAWTSYVQIGGNPWTDPNTAAVATAREMANSVRSLHYADTSCGCCYTCAECEQYWPCETAKRVYPSEELGL